MPTICRVWVNGAQALIRDEGHDNPMTVTELVERAALRARVERDFSATKRIVVEAMATNHAALTFWRAGGFAECYLGLESALERPSRQS
jgi:hypothetical protein